MAKEKKTKETQPIHINKKVEEHYVGAVPFFEKRKKLEGAKPNEETAQIPLDFNQDYPYLFPFDEDTKTISYCKSNQSADENLGSDEEWSIENKTCQTPSSEPAVLGISPNINIPRKEESSDEEDLSLVFYYSHHTPPNPYFS